MTVSLQKGLFVKRQDHQIVFFAQPSVYNFFKKINFSSKKLRDFVELDSDDLKYKCQFMQTGGVVIR